MLEDRPTYNDEIDIFAVCQSLWDGKWLISSFAVLATLIGFGYSQAAQPKYNVPSFCKPVRCIYVYLFGRYFGITIDRVLNQGGSFNFMYIIYIYTASLYTYMLSQRLCLWSHVTVFIKLYS